MNTFAVAEGCAPWLGVLLADQVAFVRSHVVESRRLPCHSSRVVHHLRYHIVALSKQFARKSCSFEMALAKEAASSIADTAPNVWAQERT